VNRERLREALSEADLPVLLAALVHATRDRRWIEPPFRPARDTRIIAAPDGGFPAAVQSEIRAAACEVLADVQADAEFPALSDALLHEMMQVCVGDEVAPEYVPLLLEEMGLRERPRPEPLGPGDDDFSVLVIGAGVGGIAASIALAEAGVDHTVIDKNNGIGGTWLENVYPEAGVDTPNHWYSFSFARNHDWRHYFSKQPEILGYLQTVADRHAVTERVRFGTTATSCRFDPIRKLWATVVVGPDGRETTLTTNAVISGVGALNRPRIPDFPGLEAFGGTVFHTARWPTDLDLTGRRVAIVGTGASCVQAARQTAQRAEHLTIFQRSPQWIAPNDYYRAEVGAGKRWLLQNVPYYAAWYRFTLFWRYGDSLLPHIEVDEDWEHTQRAVSASNDRHRRFFTRYIESELAGRPDLIAKSLPDYPPYGKRMIIDNDWFRTIRRNDVTLVDRAVARLDETGIWTDDGQHFEVDVVAMATGFHPTRFLWPLDVIGREGRSLREEWCDDDARAYLGITVPHFPNFFMLLGPGTLLGHGGSAIFMIEAQVNYTVRCILAMQKNGIATIEPHLDVFEEYNSRLTKAHERLVFSQPHVRNWYKNSRGRVVTLTPFRMVDYWSDTRVPDLSDYLTESAETAHRAERCDAQRLGQQSC
jgi:4-hydroxyacetophenone monooxygenase